MSMLSEPIAVEGEVFWNCRDELDAASNTDDEKSSSGYSGSTGDMKDWDDVAFEELGETPDLRQACLYDMRSWLTDQPHLKSCYDEDSEFRLDIPGFDSDNFLLRFLRVQKFHVLKACKMLEKYLEMRCTYPHWFMDLDPTENTSVQELVRSGYVFVLPERDQDGRRVIFNYARVFDASRFNSTDIMKTFMATFETLLAQPENQVRGLTYIFFCKGLSLSQCAVWTPSDAATMFSICEKNLPIRHRSINLLHLPMIMWSVFEFAKSFLSSKIRTRIATFSDEKKLTARLGRDILPEEFGGKIPMAEMTEAWLKEIMNNRHRLNDLDELVVNRGASFEFHTPLKHTPGKPKAKRSRLG